MKYKTSIPKYIIMGYLMLVLVPLAIASTLPVVSVDSVSAKVGKSIDVPINITRASNTGSMDITLTYDPSVLDVTNVVKGTLTGDSMVQYFIKTQGTLNIGIIDAEGFSGNGSVVIVRFKVIGSIGDTSPLNLSGVTAVDVDTLIDAGPSVSNGTLKVVQLTGDVNTYGKVDVHDLVIVGQHLRETTVPPYPLYDLNEDGKVNVLDLIIVGQNYGR